MANIQIQGALLFIAMFQVKHFVCDGPLQTAAMVRDKGHYGRFLGLAHAAIHGVGTWVVGLSFGLPAITAAMVAGLDFLLHYHIDFSKEQIVRRAGWTPAEPQFWWALSADQMLHQMTYIFLVWFALTGV